MAGLSGSGGAAAAHDEPEAEAMPRSEAEALRVEAIPGRHHVLCGVKNTVRVLLRVRTPANAVGDVQPRAPISVACVLDRSGSMFGQKLDFAKRACKKLVKHLSPCDILHFITYDHNVKVVFENGDLSDAGKDALRRGIDRVQSGGMTDLHAGLAKAAELLGGRTDFVDVDDDVGKTAAASVVDGRGGVRRIFLFSDGCVTSGVREPDVIKRHVAAWAEEGITTTAFGIGSDFDEPLMRGIAEVGKGRYTFLATARDIPRLVSKSIHDLLKLYASEASLDIRGGSYTSVSKVYSAHDDEDEGVAADGLLDLGDLHSANERMVLLELDSAPPGDVTEGLRFQAAEWMLSFQRNGAQAQFSGGIDLLATRQRAALGGESASVRAMFAIRQASDLELEVADHLGRGERARAKEVKARQISMLKGALEAARGEPGAGAADAEALERVLQRAERVAERLDDGEDIEIVRRHCVQETELSRAMSVGGFSDGLDSSEGSDPGQAVLHRRLRDFDDTDSDSDGGRSSAVASAAAVASAPPIRGRRVSGGDTPRSLSSVDSPRSSASSGGGAPITSVDSPRSNTSSGSSGSGGPQPDQAAPRGAAAASTSDGPPGRAQDSCSIM